MLSYAGKEHPKAKSGCSWAKYRTLISRVEDRERLLAELYYCESVEDVRERIKLYLGRSDIAKISHSSRKRGREGMASSRLTAYFPAKLNEMIRSTADKMRCSCSDVIRIAVENYFSE